MQHALAGMRYPTALTNNDVSLFVTQRTFAQPAGVSESHMTALRLCDTTVSDSEACKLQKQAGCVC